MARFKKILKISLGLLFVAFFLLTVGFIEAEKSKVTCKGMLITFDQAPDNSFLTKEEIKAGILQLVGDSLEGKLLSQISVRLIRERLEENSYISKATVFSSVEGWVYVRISQRAPIIRVQNLAGESFYIADDGRMIPVSFQYTARLIPVSGYISEKYNANRDLVPVKTQEEHATTKISSLQKIYLLGKYLQSDNFLSTQIGQIFVDPEGEFELIPIVGNHRVLMGNAENMEEKLGKLKTFYTEGLSPAGWKYYKTINIKYKNQVICSKN